MKRILRLTEDDILYEIEYSGQTILRILSFHRNKEAANELTFEALSTSLQDYIIERMSYVETN